LELSIPRKPSFRKFGLEQVHDGFLKLKNDHVLVKNPETNKEGAS
jgi:hypothetical protein